MERVRWGGGDTVGRGRGKRRDSEFGLGGNRSVLCFTGGVSVLFSLPAVFCLVAMGWFYLKRKG